MEATGDAEVGALRYRVAELENQLRESERKSRRLQAEHDKQLQTFDTVLAELQEFVYLFDRDGRFRYVNKPLLQLWGLTLDQAVGKNFAELGYPEELVRLHNEQIRRVIDTKEPVTGENSYTSPAGVTGHYEYTFVPLFAADGSINSIGGHTRDVTARKVADDALRQSEAEFRQVADSMPQLVWVTRPDGYHEWYNRRWYEYTGSTAEQAAGEGWNCFFHPDDQERAWAKWRHSLRTGEGYDIEYRCRRQDGVYRWFLGRALPIRDASGQIVRWFGTCTDIEEQKQAEYERKHSEALLQLVIDKVPGLVSYLDREARYKFVSGRYLDWFAGELPLGRKVADFVGEEAFRVAWPYLKRALDGEEVRFEGVLPYKHSKPRHVLVSYSPDRADDGSVQGVVAMIQDITAQKQMEEALRQSKERLQQVFAEAPVAVCVLRGRELIYELANVFYQALFPKRALLGRPLTEAVPELSPEIITALHRVLDTGIAFAANELLIPIDRTDSGVLEETWFNIVYHALRESGEDVTSIVVVAVDVTAQVRARQGLERANRELEEFAYVSSHDLQEPLRMVNIYTQLLLRDLEPHLTDNTRKHAAVVQTGVSRMERLLKDLLTFSHNIHAAGEELNPASRADLNASLAQSLSTLQNRITEYEAVVTSDPLPVVNGDETQFSHVFQNLIGNALKYRKPNEDPKVHVSVRQHGKEWLIRVSDNGIGFDQRHAERIFGLFKRLHKDAYPGTGLGLAICKRIVERYGGRIWAESTAGEGSTFVFSIPELIKQ